MKNVIIPSKVISLPLNFNHEKQIENREYMHDFCLRLSFLVPVQVKHWQEEC